jgi:MSHA pilin protein MshC
VRAPRGFSLVELVVVIVIAAIVAVLAIPRLRDTESNATWYHEQVLAAVRYAQRQAVAQHRTIFVCVEPAEVRLGYDAGCLTAPLAAPGQISHVLPAPSGITNINASTTPFSFNGLGQPTPIGGVQVSFAGRSINVAAETGYVFAN